MQSAPKRRSEVILLVALATHLLPAQQRTASPKPDQATLVTAIRDSYYHPDGMSELNCTAVVDWPALFASLKVSPPSQRLRALAGLKVQVQFLRGKSPNFTFEWTTGTLGNKEQLEGGVKQMLGGFDQMYWSLIASPPIDKGAEVTKIEPQANGGTEVFSSGQNIKLVITIDKENVPTHYVFDSPAMNGTIDLRYAPTPKPLPGDLRRISRMDVSERIGTSALNVKLGLDYQAVDGFYVPWQVSYDLGGAYSLAMEFSSCSASRGAFPDKTAK